MFMEKLLVLGTGNAGATRCYNTCFILHDGKEPLLVDAGGGNAIFTQLERAGIRPADIHHAFLTHCHTDHLFGMIWMIRSVAQNIRGGSYEGTFTLYCHDELAGVVHSVADMTLPASMTQYIGDRIHIVPVEDGEERPFGSYRATFFDIGSTKAKQFGFTLALHSGKKLSCLGDEPCTPRGRKYAAGSGCSSAKLSASMRTATASSPTRSTTARSVKPAKRQRSSAWRTSCSGIPKTPAFPSAKRCTRPKAASIFPATCLSRTIWNPSPSNALQLCNGATPTAIYPQKPANRDSIKSKVFGKGEVGFWEGKLF